MDSNGGEQQHIGKEIDSKHFFGIYDKAVMRFATYEHAHIGEHVDLEREEHRKLTLPNNVEIKYEHIIAFAGDYFGIPEHPIIDPSSQGMDEIDSGHNQRFLNAYNTLARAPREEIQNVLEKLLAALGKEIETGKSVSWKEWDKITGGGWQWGIPPYKQGLMLQLAKNNHDHFLPYAKDAYLTGHQLAMDKAREASEYGGNKRKEFLDEALSLDAFACHFLTDSFSSGHIR